MKQAPYTEAELKAKRCRSAMEASRKGLTIAVQCRDNGCGHRRVVEVEPVIRLGVVRRWEDEFNHIGN